MFRYIRGALSLLPVRSHASVLALFFSRSLTLSWLHSLDHFLPSSIIACAHRLVSLVDVLPLVAASESASATLALAVGALEAGLVDVGDGSGGLGRNRNGSGSRGRGGLSSGRSQLEKEGENRGRDDFLVDCTSAGMSKRWKGSGNTYS